MLDALGEPAAKVSVAECGKHGDVGDNEDRLVEGADEVFAKLGRTVRARHGEVHRRFAAHRGVNHRQQRGGALNDRHAAAVAGRGESRRVAHDAAAQRHDRVGPLVPCASHRGEDAFERLDALVAFAGAYDVDVDARAERGERVDHRRARRFRHSRVRDDEDASRRMSERIGRRCCD